MCVCVFVFACVWLRWPGMRQTVGNFSVFLLLPASLVLLLLLLCHVEPRQLLSSLLPDLLSWT